MSNRFIVLRADEAASGGSYETIGPSTEGFATFKEADAEARALSQHYPHGHFAVFQRRAVYATATGPTRQVDRKPPAPKDSNVTKFKVAQKFGKGS